MINAITPEQLYLILPFKVGSLAAWYAAERRVSDIEAVEAIYRSATYRELEKEQTKLWHLGPVGLTEHFEENG